MQSRVCFSRQATIEEGSNRATPEAATSLTELVSPIAAMWLPTYSEGRPRYEMKRNDTKEQFGFG